MTIVIFWKEICVLQDLLNICTVSVTLGFKLLINEPTRVTHDTETLINHIARTDPKTIVNSGVIRLEISDHYAVFCVGKFIGKLSKSPKKHLLDIDDLTIMVQLWTKMFMGILDRHAPAQG